MHNLPVFRVKDCGKRYFFLAFFSKVGYGLKNSEEAFCKRFSVHGTHYIRVEVVKVMMVSRLSAQKGFSLIRLVVFLVILAVFGLAILSFLPRIGGSSFDVVNQITSKAQSVMSGLTQKVSGVFTSIGDKLRPVGEGLSRKIEDLSDWWYCYKNPERCGTEDISNFGEFARKRALTWAQDMNLLIDLAEEQNYDMSEVKTLLDRYEQGEASSRRVEAEFWSQLQNQTATSIENNIERFRNRPLGCSDFTVELKRIWEIEQNFNAESLEGYFVAKYLSNELHDPRSTEFAQELFGWMGYDNTSWFMEQLVLGIPQENVTPDYPAVITGIEDRMRQSNNPFEWVLGHVTAAEIYLNYDLIIPAQSHYDEALRHLANVASQYGHAMPQERQIGIHMSLALLNERVCKNNDLAIKEFKDAIAVARRQNLQCELYNDAHYHLGIINLRLREGNQVKPVFEDGSSSNSETIDEIYETTPTPAPTPTPTPTPTPNPIKIIVEIPTYRSLRPDPESDAQSRALSSPDSTMKVIKGNIVVPRSVRLKPRTELGDSQKMKNFTVDTLYDLSNIPDGAIRELEFYLRCSSTGPRVEIARYIHNKYMGK